ncbi:DUF3710 domain-containing protein [Streptomyces sp. NPDC101225]|uniref:DUF3710 domain-containing protein n=1 Tax=Streptomyces sp. NPDC101225 TaxID=3366135 RepID=UPI00382B6FC9
MDARRAGTLYNLTALLDAVRRRGQLFDPDLAALLEWAEDGVEEALALGELTGPRIRDGQVGPWDLTEVETATESGAVVPGDRIDLGALRVPVVAGMGIWSDGIDPQGEGSASAITVHVGGTSLQLQVFSAPEDGEWERVRGKLMAKIASQGGASICSVKVCGLGQAACSCPGW